MGTKEKELLYLKFGILDELGYKLNSKAIILDFGCGNGELVQEYRSNGFRAFGCDLEFRSGPNVGSLQKDGIIRLIDKNPYKIPFKNETFDFVSTDQVFEHVQDYSTAVSEIQRVLKPDGISIHIFPARYRPIEPHIYVPFASLMQKYWWLSLWAKLGIRNEYQKRLSSRETAVQNYEYLHSRTNYLPKKAIKQYFCAYFNNIIFCEQQFLKYSQRGKYIYYISNLIHFPLIPMLYSTFHARVILASNHKRKLAQV